MTYSENINVIGDKNMFMLLALLSQQSKMINWYLFSRVEWNFVNHADA